MNRSLVIAAVLTITGLSFFVFPGHTYLQQDTQIYVPILENQWDGALSGDLIVQHPHVNFTLYDELTNSLRWVTRAPLQPVLQFEQLVFRAIGFWGIYLIAIAFGLDVQGAIVTAAICALGAAIKGPEVLTIEYEPTPRSFAVPLLLLAVALTLHKRYWFAGLTGACAFLLHAPTTWPFWLAYLLLICIHARAAVGLTPLAAAATLLITIALVQPTGEHQRFFDRLPQHLEQLQRMRAAYNYVSTWWTTWLLQYLIFGAISFMALFRLRARREPWALLGGLVIIGLLSVPLSWLLLEQAHLAIIPQVQPARALLFVTEIAVLTAAIAGCVMSRKRALESAAWFGFALLVPAQAGFSAWPGWRALLVIIILALLLGWSLHTTRTIIALLLPVAMSIAAGVVDFRNIETPDLAALAGWARLRGHGIYVFPEAGHDRAPGWFRAQALQPVYVDWKGGGQVNYLLAFGEEWWRRWQRVMLHPVTLNPHALTGIDFVVLPRRLAAAPEPAYRNSHWYVYRVSPQPNTER